MANSYWQLYEVVVGWDTLPDPDADNLEFWFALPLRGTRVPLGSTVVTVLSGEETSEGHQDITLTTEGCTFAELDAYVTAIFGDFNTQNADVTIRTRNRDNTFSYYNAIAHLPLDQSDYEHITTLLVQNVVLRFRILGLAAV